MVVLETYAVRETAFADGRVASLGVDPAVDGFHVWRGASGERHVTTVYPVDPLAADAGLPWFQSFVLVCVAREGSARHILAVSAVERSGDRAAALAAAVVARVDEWHVHLTGETRAVRARVVADLSALHVESRATSLFA